MFNRVGVFLNASLLVGGLCSYGLAQTAVLPTNQPASKTQIVLLGTGNPFPDPDRSGPATAIVVNGSAYLVDFGAGVVRRAKAAMFDKGIPERLRTIEAGALYQLN